MTDNDNFLMHAFVSLHFVINLNINENMFKVYLALTILSAGTPQRLIYSAINYNLSGLGHY